MAAIHRIRNHAPARATGWRLLLGYAQGATNGTTGTSNLRAQNDYAYFQDEWKVTQRLTLNLGARYEIYWPITDTENKLGNFVLNPSSPNYGKMIFATLGGQSRSMMTVDSDNLAPRFGFAYRVPHTSDMSIRGGFGIFYGNPDEQIGVGAMMTNNPPFVGLGGNTITGDHTTTATAFNLSGSFPAFPAPVTPANFVLNPSSTTSLQGWPSRYTAPIVQQWNLSIEKQLPGNMLFEISYVGNHTYDLWTNYTGNQPLVPGPGSVTTRRPLAAFTDAPITINSPWVMSYYEGMAMRLEKRMSHGLYFLASFSYGRAMDLSSGAGLDGCSYCGVSESVQNAYDLYAERGPSDSNVPRRVVFSAAYDSPFGQGKRYVQSGWAAQLLGGWQTSGIYTIQDGAPFTLDLSFDNANVGQTNYPNRICNGQITNWTVHDYFNQSCFPTAPAYTFGNAGRNFLNGPGLNNMDFTLHRFFRIPGRGRYSTGIPGRVF